VVLNPKHGYGAHLNPCLDCKIFMVKKAQEWIEAQGFDFIITGEVIGQRPKSQRKRVMPIIAAESGAEDRLLRPLCAQNLAPSLAEREGWVDRAQLFDFSGRSRKPQMALAKEFGLEEYAQPAGGCCFLTDENYARKLADMWQHRGDKRYELDDIMLLKVGRHLRPAPHYKLIISREEGENNFLEGYRKQFTHLRITSHTGPLVLIEGDPSAEDLQLAAQISARYSAGREADQVGIEVETLNGVNHAFSVKPLAAHEIPSEWML